MLQLIDRWHLRRVFFLLWCATWVGVVYGSLKPTLTLPAEMSDKSVHFLAYAGMTLGTALFCRSWRPLLLLACSAALLGIVLEFGQLMVPSRTFELADMVANSAGVVAGGGVVASLLFIVTLRQRATARISAAPDDGPPSVATALT